MLTNEEITKYISVYFDHNINSKHDFKNYEWPSLAKFLIQWRRDDIKKDNPLLEFWITKIAPSCVYQRKIINSEEFSCVVCVNRGFKRVGYLISYYHNKIENSFLILFFSFQYCRKVQEN